MLPINSLLNGVLLRNNNLERDSQQMAIGAESVSDCPRTRNLLPILNIFRFKQSCSLRIHDQNRSASLRESLFMLCKRKD